ncbi:class I SAM-dependent methyltransferase [Thiobacter aerophilum]|uniref:Class I SAM-dependent methyltransferase n=1 Tax=Thiobacter aerophilum TaxID=3121275 RepID=A0ABV0ECV2_9BURK
MSDGATPTLESYDLVPYESIPIPATHPDALAAVARLAGLSPPPINGCRVLELGAASGGNLIPMAFYRPGNEYVGVDLSLRQVEEGQALIAALGLDHVHLLHRDVAAGLEDLGRFDYVIAHGLYSWVPAPLRERLLELIAKVLAPRGIAYVSYNTLPGWRARAMVRDMLLAHVGTARHPRARLALAQEFLARMAPAFAALETPEAGLMAQELAYLRTAPAGYLYHEYLEAENEPVLFSTFLAQAQAAGLAYVGDAEPATDLGQGLDAAARAAVADYPLPRRLQYYDFLALRPFRRSLLTPLSAGEPVLDCARIAELALFADLSSDEEIDLSRDTPQAFRSATRTAFQASHPLTKAALVVLAERFPSAVAYGELAAAAQAVVRAHGDARLAQEDQRLATELAALAGHRLVGLAPDPQEWAVQPAPRPRLHTMARHQVSQGLAPAGIRHSALELDEAARALALLCDGEHDLPALASAMRNRWPDFSPEETLVGCARLLWTFARNGLLEPIP